MTKIGIVGANGRMGRAIAEVIGETPRVALAGGVGRDDGDLAALAAASDVLIDFSSPAALDATLTAARAAGVAVVTGTTGLDALHHGLIDAASADIPVLQTGNTSLGVNLLAHLVRDVAARLGEDWDIELVEMHHRHKVDAPSGTAQLLGRAAAQGRGVSLDDVAVRARDGITGARAPGTIGFSAMRGGSVAGDHMVVFAGEGERIELGHRADSRAIFARGAVKAAEWLSGKPAGRYAMSDVLGL